MAYNPQIEQWFAAVDADRSGRITAPELQAALMSSNGRKFNDTACRLMIGLFDGGSGAIDMQGFGQLYNYVNQWLSAFRAYDKNGSGYIDNAEFAQSLQAMGYRFSQQFIDTLAFKFGERNAGLPVDGFITVCILIQKFTDGFRKRDLQQQGVITIQYEDFLGMILTAWT